jgi:hypothetical protein
MPFSQNACILMHAIVLMHVTTSIVQGPCEADRNLAQRSCAGPEADRNLAQRSCAGCQLLACSQRPATSSQRITVKQVYVTCSVRSARTLSCLKL